MKFTEILQAHRIGYRTEGKHTRRGWIQLDCPFCLGPLYMGYNLAFGTLNCWRCGPKRPLEVLQKLTGEPWNDLRKLLSDLDREVEVEVPKRGRLILPKGIGPLLQAHRRYLQRRGFDSTRLERLWQIRAIGHASELSWRVFIPIHYRNKIVSWTTRSISDTVTTRYVSASIEQEELDHKDLLYGEDYCRHSIIVHEGPTDVWRTGPGAVSTFGTGFSAEQVLKISKYPNRAICFDNEPEAQRRACDLCDRLEMFPGHTYRIILDSKDAATAHEKQIKELRERFLV